MTTSVKQLLEAGVHFGHRKDQWNPKTKSFIYQLRSGSHIIDISQTLGALDRACAFIEKAVRAGKIVAFVGTKRQAAEIVEEEAKRCGVHFVNRRWLGGTLTNFETIRSRMSRLRDLDEMKDSGELFRRPKKELSCLNREYYKLEKHLGGLKLMKGRPDVMFVIDQTRESSAITEARKVGCTIIALIDSNADPDGVDYVIPGNDDSTRSVRLITRRIADAVLLGKSPPDQNDDGPDWQPAPVPKSPYPYVGVTELAMPVPQFDDE